MFSHVFGRSAGWSCVDDSLTLKCMLHVLSTPLRHCVIPKFAPTSRLASYFAGSDLAQGMVAQDVTLSS